MRMIRCLLVLLCVVSGAAWADDGDAVLGQWLTADGKAGANQRLIEAGRFALNRTGGGRPL